MLNRKTRYLQIAFNDDLFQAWRILPLIPASNRILIEAGTPFIKREGLRGIKAIRQRWRGGIVADLKTSDGAVREVEFARDSGATAATVMGSCPPETLNLFIGKCAELGLDSMIDLLGVEDPMPVLRSLKKPPAVVVLHKGRDEESTRGKVIRYKHVNKIKSKYDVIISAAGGIDLREARSAIFNGANIVVANLVSGRDPWTGIKSEGDIGRIAAEFLRTIE